MRIWATLHKKNKIISDTTASSENQDAALALMECLEKVYKEFDVAEPVWVSKHARELSVFLRTKFLPSDFLEPVFFDWFEVEILSQSE